jgi:hypothetical protein
MNGGPLSENERKALEQAQSYISNPINSFRIEKN